MSVPPDHTLIPLNIMGIQILESMLDMKFTLSNKTIFNLHLLLRHSDDVDNCDTGGFFRVSYVLSEFNAKPWKLVNTVFNNNKNRYQFSIFSRASIYSCLSGHSGKILDKLIPEHIYSIYSSDNNVFHRTTSAISDIIFSSDNNSNGLRPIGRQVHMATNESFLVIATSIQ